MLSATSEPPVEQFPWHFFIFFQFLYLSVCYPTKNAYLRQWILAPTAVAVSIYLFSKQACLKGMSAYQTGANITVPLCSIIYLVYVQTGFPDFWRRVKDERSGEKIKLPSEFAFRKKIWWALDLNFSARRIGWVQEQRNAFPPRPTCSRIAFVRSRILYGLVHFLVKDLVITHHTGNPSFDRSVHRDADGPEAYIGRLPPLWRIPDLLSCGLHMFSTLALLHTIAAVLCVGGGISEPADWPPVFGSFRDAYTLRQFWGKVWHQLFRPMLSGISKFVAHDVFGFNPGTNLSSYTQLYTAFFVSGLIHMGNDYMLIGRLTWSSFLFFLLQAVVISFEDFVIWIAKPFESKMGHRMTRAVGYAWVILLFCLMGPMWVDSLSPAGFYDGESGYIFDKVLGLWRARL